MPRRALGSAAEGAASTTMIVPLASGTLHARSASCASLCAGGMSVETRPPRIASEASDVLEQRLIADITIGAAPDDRRIVLDQKPIDMT